MKKSQASGSAVTTDDEFLRQMASGRRIAYGSGDAGAPVLGKTNNMSWAQPIDDTHTRVFAMVRKRRGHPAQGLPVYDGNRSWFELAVATFAEAGDDPVSAARLDWNLSGLLIDRNRPEEALAHLDRFIASFYPTRFLADCLRGRKLATLERAVEMITKDPAELFGLRDRGQIREGFAADIVIFNPATVRETTTFEKTKSYPEGIPYTIVNGVVVIDNPLLRGLAADSYTTDDFARIPATYAAQGAGDIIRMTHHFTDRSPGNRRHEPMARLAAPMPVHARGAPDCTSTA